MHRADNNIKKTPYIIIIILEWLLYDWAKLDWGHELVQMLVVCKKNSKN